MKLALLALVLLASSAHADVILYIPNDSGGSMKFTDTRCPKGGLLAYTTSGDGHLVERGCWAWSEPDIVVVWADSKHVMYYDISTATFTKAGNRAVDKMKSKAL